MNKIPKMILLAMFLIKSLDLRETTKLCQQLVYLWREFYIKTRLIPIIKEFVVEFKYKDETLTSCKINDLKDLIKLIDEIKTNRIMKEDTIKNDK